MKLLDDHPGHRLGDPGLQETQEAPGQVESLRASQGQALGVKGGGPQPTGVWTSWALGIKLDPFRRLWGVLCTRH